MPIMNNRLLTTLAAAFLGALLAAPAGAAEPSSKTKSKPAREQAAPEKKTADEDKKSDDAESSLEEATFGAGCFWCAEAVFQRLKGVRSVVSGYSGGQVKDPTYEQVHSGLTGHAEVVRITFDSKVISYDELLNVFWKMHDPTSLNRQGLDVGTQYRSVIFYHSDEQKKQAEASRQKLAKSGRTRRIVTEISPAGIFYPAEDDHQNYFNEHPDE